MDRRGLIFAADEAVAGTFDGLGCSSAAATLCG